MMNHKIPEILISYFPPLLITKMPTVNTSLIAYTLFIEYFPASTISLQERFVVLYLNKANKPLGMFVASVGGLTGTIVDIRIILAIGLKVACTGIMLAHNHPSGSLKPSCHDESITQRIKDACVLLEIRLLDHLIVTSEDRQYYSFNDEGML